MELNENTPNLSDVFRITQLRMVDILAQQIDIVDTSNALNSLLNLVGDMISTELVISMRVAHVTTSVLLETLKQAAQVLSKSYQTAGPIEIPSDTLESLQELSPLVPEEKREEFEKIVAPENSKEWKLITVENIKWLLGIIIPILVTLYIHQLPDKNAEESLQLHREFNDIGREIAEALEPDSEETTIEKFLQYLDDNGFVLMAKDEVICEQSERIPNCMGVLKEGTDAVDDLVVPDEQDNNQAEQN